MSWGRSRSGVCSSGTGYAPSSAEHVQVADRVASRVERGAVEHVRQGAVQRSNDVTQKLQTEALALTRALDEPRHVGDGESGLS